MQHASHINVAHLRRVTARTDGEVAAPMIQYGVKVVLFRMARGSSDGEQATGVAGVPVVVELSTVGPEGAWEAGVETGGCEPGLTVADGLRVWSFGPDNTLGVLPVRGSELGLLFDEGEDGGVGECGEGAEYGEQAGL